jgi:hypothetical protein
MKRGRASLGMCNAHPCTHNLVVELVFHLEMSMFLDALELHVLEHAMIFVLIELSFKKLGDGLKSLGVKLLASCNKFVAVVFMKQHVDSLKRKHSASCRLAGLWWS